MFVKFWSAFAFEWSFLVKLYTGFLTRKKVFPNFCKFWHLYWGGVRNFLKSLSIHDDLHLWALYRRGPRNFLKSSSAHRGKSSKLFQVPEHVWGVICKKGVRKKNIAHRKMSLNFWSFRLIYLRSNAFNWKNCDKKKLKSNFSTIKFDNYIVNSFNTGIQRK